MHNASAVAGCGIPEDMCRRLPGAGVDCVRKSTWEWGAWSPLWALGLAMDSVSLRLRVEMTKSTCAACVKSERLPRAAVLKKID